ncbi:MAG: signal peptidase I [Verrucomicrobiaceae bacterium]
MFTPRWKKEALLLYKGAKKFVHYKRDLLEPDKVAEIESRRADLKAAVKQKDLDAVKEASKQVRNVCEKSLTHYRPPNAIEENIEVFWVAIVVALGVRAYFVQPFRIPTGSMQPSLNGIIAETKHEEENWEMPWLGQRITERVIKGKSYEDVVAKRDLSIRSIDDRSWFLFSRTKLSMSDGSVVTIGAPKNEVMRIPTIRKTLLDGSGKNFRPGIHYRAGDPIFQGSLTSGDLVLVDKVSYHFRQPTRGESFVFNTRGIDTHGTGDRMSSQQGGTHYIKRLVGVPGDTLQVDAPHLYVNGSLAEEETIQRVASQENGYPGYTNTQKGDSRSGFSDSEFSVTLQDNPDRNYREFFALGDNSPESLDSRYWGSVKQYNLVGPALFSLWPFTSGHWGLIE